MNEPPYGVVYVTTGRLKGRIMYYDDNELSKAICYAGHPLDFPGCYNIPRRYLREPLVDDLLSRMTKISQKLSKVSIDGEWLVDPEDIHELWCEKYLIANVLFERRNSGKIEHQSGHMTIFLCHSSSDKGVVRQINDDLRQRGVKTWLDENNIRVGDSIVGKISDALKEAKFLAVFLSRASVQSLWTRKEWQSFLARQLSGKEVIILPILLEECEIPEILADLKYADFTKSYSEGLAELSAALR